MPLPFFMPPHPRTEFFTKKIGPVRRPMRQPYKRDRNSFVILSVFMFIFSAADETVVFRPGDDIIVARDLVDVRLHV